MTTATAHRVPLAGPFDFAAVATMGFGHRDESSFDGVMRMAFCVDGDYESQVGVEVRQDGDDLDVLIAEQPGAPPVDPDRVLAQVARVVSADHDGDAYAAVCQADPVLARVWSLAPGFRPALFYSPYEAAVWSILSARRARRQAIPIRERLANEYGATLASRIGRLLQRVDRRPRRCGLADAACLRRTAAYARRPNGPSTHASRPPSCGVLADARRREAWPALPDDLGDAESLAAGHRLADVAGGDAQGGLRGDARRRSGRLTGARR